MDGALASRQATQFLLTAYPNDDQRGDAARWLGWVAYHMGDSRILHLGVVPSWVPTSWLRFTRRLVVLLVWCALAGIGYETVPRWPLIVLPLIIIALLLPLELHIRRSAIRLTELVLLVQWRERVRVRSVVMDAVARGVMSETRAGYQFADPSMQTVLAALHTADLHVRDRRKAAQAARPGVRPALIAFLTDRHLARLSVDFGIGAGIFGAIYFFDFHPWDFDGPLTPFGKGFWAVVTGAWGGFAAATVLTIVTLTARGTLTNIPSLSRRQRLLVMLAAAVTAAIMATTRTGIAPAVYALPATLVAVCGLWACRVVCVKIRKVRRPRMRGLLTLIPEVIGIATVTAAILLLTERNLVTTEPAAGFLFPVAVWGSARAWLAMKNSDRSLVRAGADITLSLLLGAELVLFLVWLANLLGMPRTEVAALRVILRNTADLVDLPWWTWTALYVLLAAASLAFTLRPQRTRALQRWLQRLRVMPAVNLARRVLNGVHIGLLIIVLVSLTAPAALISTFQRQLPTSYTVALQRQLEAEGELAAYTQVRREFGDRTAPPALVQVFVKIHDDSHPAPGDDDATSGEDDLAQRVGVLQAQTLNPENTRALLAAAEAAAKQAGLDGPLRSESDLAERLGAVDAQDQNEDETSSTATQAGDLAASALASTISIAGVSGHETFQIAREYLSGLVEESSLKDMFAAWAERLPGIQPPPEARTMVTPDPAELKHAAYDELASEFAAVGNTRELSNDQAANDAMNESPVDAAVDLASQSLQDSGSSCTACMTPVQPGDDEPPPVDDGE